MALEALILRSGAPAEALPTMLCARKPVSVKVYHRVWKTFISWCELRGTDPQKAKEKGDSVLSTGGINEGFGFEFSEGSTLSILFQEKLALKSNIRTFLQGATHLVPPYRYPVAPWDLNLVLSVLHTNRWTRFLCQH